VRRYVKIEKKTFISVYHQRRSKNRREKEVAIFRKTFANV